MTGRRSAAPRAGRAPKTADVARFVERLAVAMASAGFPRMPARVFVTLLVAEDGRRTAAELASSLKVSRAAVSGAVKFIEGARLIVREREPGNAVDHYRVLADMWVENMVRKDVVLTSWEQALAEGVLVLGPSSEAGRRLAETQQFFAFVREEFSGIIDRWKKRRDEIRKALRAR